MSHIELKEKFQVTGKLARDFIRWADGHGVKVYDATVSKHLAGTQGITEPWKLAYLWFFSQPTLNENIKAFRQKHGGGLGPEHFNPADLDEF